MGSSSSKFKKYLQHGDEFAAMQVFQSSPELRKNLDPNLSYGESHSHNTALHYAAKHGMKHLLRTFLVDLGGNPNKKNGLNETVLHAACQLDQQKSSYSAQERRATCVTLLLQWKGVALNTGGREKVDINAQDQEGNTALHWAAFTGLKRSVELLVNQQGSALFIENNDKMTPCDLAMKNNHHDIARLLEARMVFADNSDTVNEDEFGYDSGEQEVYSGLRTQDLQEAKDQLLVETSDMLHIPLFTAEALLRDNEWSREALLEKWMKDPVQCCQLAGVQAPSSALQQAGSVELTLSSTNSSSIESNSEKSDVTCEICLTCMPVWDQNITMSCKHNFCSYCWERYLNIKIEEGDAHHIQCPAYQCHILVPVEFIEKLVSPDMARRYLQFDIKAFVESNKSIKWCPMAGCGRAVRLPEMEQYQPSSSEHILNTANSNFKPPPATSHAVDCGNAHFFCWECLGEAHAPCGCAQWQQWQQKIAEIKPEELRANCDESEAAANCLWLVTNSKPCPNCKSPIQKNEGCNHMKCSKCKFDFCWVCQESWKRHSSATGGYFRCNRFEAVNKADEKQGNLITEAVVRNSQLEELTRFLHYYTRFRNHENSQKLEEPLLTGVRQKMEILANSLPSKGADECGERDTKFVEDGVRELLKARRVLCGSYVYGYYLEDNGYNKTIFEFMQNELEEVTEKLSEMIARPYLRTPKAVIVQTTALARRKRHEFVRAVSKGLIPPETPPTLRKVRKRRYPIIEQQKMESEMHQAIAASLKNLDPNNPWVKEAHARHSSLAAIYDWPDYDSDEESDINRSVSVTILGECARAACSRPRARNPRDGSTHPYCSFRCSQRDTEHIDYRISVASDYNMDLVIALEMSRLQMIEDRMKQVTDIGQEVVSVLETLRSQTAEMPGTSDSTIHAKTINSQDSIDDQLKLAIHLSLQESTARLNKQLREKASIVQKRQQNQNELVSTSTQAPEHNAVPQNSETDQNNYPDSKHNDTHKNSSCGDPVSCVHSNYDCASHLDVSSGDYRINGIGSHIRKVNRRCENCNTPLPNDSSDLKSCQRSYNFNTSPNYNDPPHSSEPNAFSYSKTKEDLTVDYFLKSLANQTLEYDVKNSELTAKRNEYDPDYYKSNEKELPGFFKTTSTGIRNEDGRFQISDIHESGYIEFVKDDDRGSDIFNEQSIGLKRSHSTGDLIIRKSRRGSRIRLGLAGTVVNTDEPKYHLDSDHSSNHEEKCEDIARKILALPAATYGAKQFLIMQHQSEGANIGTPMDDHQSSYLQNQNSSSIEETSIIYYQGSSMEETTTSDSIKEDESKDVTKKIMIQRQDSFDGDSEALSNDKTDEMPPITLLTAPKAESSPMGTFELRNYNKSPKLLRTTRQKEMSFEENDANNSCKFENKFKKTTAESYFYNKTDDPKHKAFTTPASNSTSNDITSPTKGDNGQMGSFVIETEIAETVPTSKMNPLACLKAKLCSAHLPKTSYLTKLAVNRSIGILGQNSTEHNSSSSKEKYSNRKKNANTKGADKTKSDGGFCESRNPFKIGGGKSISQNLRIKICKSPSKSHAVLNNQQPTTKCTTSDHCNHRKGLETDSSNEYESETGIPKSPTLYISGVSISRTPEQKNQTINMIANISIGGKKSRSSSLTVPASMNGNPLGDINISNTSLNIHGSPEPYTPSLARSMTPQSSYNNLKDIRSHSKSPSPAKTPLMDKENCPIRMSRSNGSTPCKPSTGNNSMTGRIRSNSGVITKDVAGITQQSIKSKSANEPEREREVFRFPKSSTDGALSSVLHVQESNLSSDDFHEALFLLERSPKTRDSKRRKKSKKKDKDADAFKKEEASSVL